MILTFKITKEQSVKEFIYEKISRNFYGYLKELNAKFYLNNEEVKSYNLCLMNDVLKIEYEELKVDKGIYSDKPLKIVFEDENYLVIDKEPGLLSIPSTKNPSDSIYNRCLYYFKDTPYTTHLINRLDKDTSGLVLIAKNKLAVILLKQVNKVYLAKTKTLLEPLKGQIKLALKKEETGIKRYVDKSSSNYAITNYFYLGKERNIYTYKVILETGKTHQIRVHFSYLGSPLINDPLYNNEEITGDLGLICKEIGFQNPFNLQVYNFKSQYK